MKKHKNFEKYYEEDEDFKYNKKQKMRDLERKKNKRLSNAIKQKNIMEITSDDDF